MQVKEQEPTPQLIKTFGRKPPNLYKVKCQNPPTYKTINRVF